MVRMVRRSPARERGKAPPAAILFPQVQGRLPERSGERGAAGGATCAGLRMVRHHVQGEAGVSNLLRQTVPVGRGQREGQGAQGLIRARVGGAEVSAQGRDHTTIMRAPTVMRGGGYPCKLFPAMFTFTGTSTAGRVSAWAKSAWPRRRGFSL